MWGDLTSIAEVGLGINLALGTLRQIREGFTSRFQRTFEERQLALKAFASEGMAQDIVNSGYTRALNDYAKTSARIESGARLAAVALCVVCTVELVLAGIYSDANPQFWVRVTCSASKT